MAKSNPFLSSINSGEFSSRMEARVDFDRYPNAAKLCRNMLLLPQGGMTRRPGSRHVAEVKDSSKDTNLIAFQFSEDDAYVIEAGDEYMRFYRRQHRLDLDANGTSITNGTFASDASGWTLGGSAAWSSGALSIPNAGTAVQQVAINAGDVDRQLCLTFDFSGFGQIFLSINDHSSPSTVYFSGYLNPGFHAIGFVPTLGTDMDVSFTGVSSAGGNLTLDNVQILDDMPLEIGSPFAAADLDALRPFQAGDVVYLMHQSYKTRRLERRDTYTWSLVEVDFTDGPYLSTNDLGTGEIFDYTAKQRITNPFFENGLQGWTDASAGDAKIFDTSNGAEMDPGTSGGSGNAKLRTSFSGASDADDFTLMILVVNASVTLNVGTSAGGTGIVNGQTLKPGWNNVAISSSAATIHVEFTYNGYGERAAIGTCEVFGTASRMIKSSATGTGSVTLTAIGFTPFISDDVGRLIRLNWPGSDSAYGIITAYTSSTVVTALIVTPVPVSSVYTPNWNFGSFGSDRGFPKVLGFFDGRLAVANTPAEPQATWFSQSGDLQNMRPDSFVEGVLTVEDDDAIAVTLNSKRIDPILWLGELENLLLGTAGAEWRIASSGPVIVPTDIFAKIVATIPVGDLEPIQVNQALIFADKSRRELYEMVFSTEQGGYIPEVLTILADHIFKSPAHLLTFQRLPHSILWCPREDGRAATLAYNRDHEVLGWSQQIMGGAFSGGDPVIEHAAVIPGVADAGQYYDSDDRDEVWLIVKRTIGGVTKRYVEMIEGQFQGPLREDYDTEEDWRDAMIAAQEDAFYVDAGITYDGSATSVISGLDHLEGEEVAILADGKVHPNRTVASGQISLTASATKVQAGLSYKSRYLSLKLATGTEQGTAIGKVKTIAGVTTVLLDSGNYKITTYDHDREEGRKMHPLVDVDLAPYAIKSPADPIPLYSGEAFADTSGNWSTDPRVYIETELPLPLTVLGIAPLIDARDAPGT